MSVVASSECMHGLDPAWCAICKPAAATSRSRSRRGYSSGQAQKATKVTYRQMSYWVTRGIIRPSGAVGEGSGTQHRWSLADLRALRAIAALSELGSESPTLCLVQDVVAQASPDEWLMAGPGRVRVVTKYELVEALCTDEPAWYVVRLGALWHDLPEEPAS